jgi:hypothetical protein
MADVIRLHPSHIDENELTGSTEVHHVGYNIGACDRSFGLVEHRQLYSPDEKGTQRPGDERNS